MAVPWALVAQYGIPLIGSLLGGRRKDPMQEAQKRAGLGAINQLPGISSQLGNDAAGFGSLRQSMDPLRQKNFMQTIGELRQDPFSGASGQAMLGSQVAQTRRIGEGLQSSLSAMNGRTGALGTASNAGASAAVQAATAAQIAALYNNLSAQRATNKQNNLLRANQLLTGESQRLLGNQNQARSGQLGILQALAGLGSQASTNSMFADRQDSNDVAGNIGGIFSQIGQDPAVAAWLDKLLKGRSRTTPPIYEPTEQ